MYSVELSSRFKKELKKVLVDLNALIGTEITQRYIDDFKAIVDWRIDNFKHNIAGTKIQNGEFKNFFSFEIKKHTFIFNCDRTNKIVYLLSVFCGAKRER